VVLAALLLFAAFLGDFLADLLFALFPLLEGRFLVAFDLLDALVNDRVAHNGQDEFINQMNNVAAKTNDSGWRIVKRQSAGDISAPISAAMIVHELLKPLSMPQIIAG
jgi:hypothetical protein